MGPAMTSAATPQRETLHDTAVRHEVERHSCRLHELAAMKDQLAVLDTYLQPLKAAGLVILPDEISRQHDGSLIPIPPLMGTKLAQQFVAAFMAQGFTEVRRKPAFSVGSYQHVVLSDGRIELQFTVGDEPAATY